MLVLIGPTCSGKDTLAKALTDNFGYGRVLEYTTRLRRDTEQSGREYWFVSDETFHNKVDNNELIGVREFNRYQNGVNDVVYYGTEKSAMATDINNVLTTNIGAAKLLQEYAHEEDYTIFVVGITIDKENQRERLIARGDDADEIEQRLMLDESAYTELADVADLIVTNNTGTNIEVLAAEIDAAYKACFEHLG